MAGQSARQAAESAFRKLAIPGIMALLANALGFLVIMVIDIPIVHELGLTAYNAAVLTAEAEMEGYSPVKVTQRLIDKVEVPK